jgi:murein DD-endopeptidase MepM/ murein hydrolase activator NlpD
MVDAVVVIIGSKPVYFKMGEEEAKRAHKLLTQNPPPPPAPPSKYPVFLWPTELPSVVTQAFGVNHDIYKKWGLPGHEGIDMKAADGSKIKCVWDGTVYYVENYAGDPSKQPYGNSIRVEHKINGITYKSIYAHFKKPTPLKVGDPVIKGQLLGFADSTGNSTGTHLHFMLKQVNGEVPDTPMQNKYKAEWAAKQIIDPTPFFAELN